MIDVMRERIIKANNEKLKKEKEVARAEGKAEGKAEGRAEVIAESELKGELKATLKIARNLKNSGIPIEQIIIATGLSKEEVEKLN